MSPVLAGTIAPLIYAAAATCMLLGIGATTRIQSASRGRILLMVSVLLAVVGRVLEVGLGHAGLGLACLAGGTVVGLALGSQVKPTAAPSTVAWIAALGGASAAATSLIIVFGASDDTAAMIASTIGASLGISAVVQGGLLGLSAGESHQAAARAAFTVVLAGGAVGAVGFAVQNVILLIAGGATGLAAFGLGRVMGRAAGRTFGDLAFGSAAFTRDGYLNVRACGAEEAAMVIETARNVLIVPGFGMAVAQAQHAVKQLADNLEKRGATVRYAVHPSAGCVPGHINGILDEANVPHALLAELDEANQLAAQADVVLCLGANDVVNPNTDGETSPLYGMPTIDLSKARSVFVVKRSLKGGASGAKNPLFSAPQTTMVFGDAKRVTQQLVSALAGGGH